MKWSAAALGLAAIAIARPEAGSEDLKPDSQAPEGCSANYDGKFEVTIYKLGNSKRSIEKRDCSNSKALVLTLNDSVLKDSQDRIGSIVANYQFQFDGPPAQAGAIYTAGFSTCQNGSLALGGSTVFYQCLSGDFYNLYDRHWAEQCEPVEIVAMPCSQPGGGNPLQSTVGASQVVTTIVTALPDGQPQVTTATVSVPMCQIDDGQVQAHSTPCDKAPGAAISQISDGQIQAPTDLPAISQIPDGQIQVPTSTGAPVNQISDGQIQVPSSTGAPVNQISDGQIQVPTTVPITNAGVKAVPALFAAGMGAVFFL